jgi:hypothetical protein
MNNKINDAVFGEMEYSHGWKKSEEIKFWDECRDLKIIASAFAGNAINDIQRANYEFFKSEISEISKCSLEAVKEYMVRLSGELHDISYKSLTDVYVKGIVKPTSVIFQEDGSFGLLCDFDWDNEHGLGVQIKPEYKAGTQDILL